jgi:hypothetical protein
MYNAYQSRVTSARETMAQLGMQFDNAMKEAKMQGNAAMAELAFKGYQQQLELALQSFQMGNQLLLDKIDQKTQLDNMYYGRQQDVINQMNHEAATAEQIRQYNEQMAEERRQYEEQMALKQKDYEEGVRQFNEQLAEEKRQFDEQMGLKKGTVSGSTGSEIAGPDNGNPDSTTENPSEKPENAPKNQYHNHGFDEATVRKAETFIGATPDGKWDEKDAKLAKKMQLYHLLDVIDTMNDTGYEMPEETKGKQNVENRNIDIENWIAKIIFKDPGSVDAMIASSDFLKTEAEREYARAVADYLA